MLSNYPTHNDIVKHMLINYTPEEFSWHRITAVFRVYGLDDLHERGNAVFNTVITAFYNTYNFNVTHAGLFSYCALKDHEDRYDEVGIQYENFATTFESAAESDLMFNGVQIPEHFITELIDIFEPDFVLEYEDKETI